MTSPRRSPLLYFLLVFLLTTPFWVMSTMVKMGGLPDNLPVTDIGATFVPLLPALILVYREEKLHGVKRLLKRAFDRDRIKQRDWYVREQRLRGHPDARDGKHWQKCLSGQYRFA